MAPAYIGQLFWGAWGVAPLEIALPSHIVDDDAAAAYMAEQAEARNAALWFIWATAQGETAMYCGGDA